MKVVHIFWSFGYGGIETMLANIVNEQAKLGADISLIIINDLIEEELLSELSPQIQLFKLNRKLHAKSLSFIFKLNKTLDEINPDIIHLHSGSLHNFLQHRWSKSSSCKVCLTLHDLPHGALGFPIRIIRLLQRLILHQGGNVINTNRVDQVFSISHVVANALKNRYGVESTVIHNGIFTNSFNLRGCEMYRNKFRIVQVSRLYHNKKGQDLLLIATKQLLTKGYECQLDFIGDGDSRKYLESLSNQLELQGYVNFLGSMTQKQIKEKLNEYDLFVQPSRIEGFGLTVVEAMASRVPVLVSSGQGPAEITEDNKYGWIFECGNSDSLAERIEFLINNYNLCLEKATKAVDYVKRNFDVSVTSQKYLDAYKQLINSHK